MTLGFRVSARIAKPVAEVFDAVVNPKKLSGYFTTIGGASAPLVPGTTVTWWNEVPVEVDEVVPPKHIVLRWDASVPAEEAPYKKSFFGAPVDPAAVPAPIEEDALYLAGKQPLPRERRPGPPRSA